MKFNDNLKKYRTLAGITQEALAKHLNVSINKIYNREKGKTQPDIDDINKMCKLFGVTSQELIGIHADYAISIKLNN